MKKEDFSREGKEVLSETNNDFFSALRMIIKCSEKKVLRTVLWTANSIEQKDEDSGQWKED